MRQETIAEDFGDFVLGLVEQDDTRADFNDTTI